MPATLSAPSAPVQRVALLALSGMTPVAVRLAIPFTSDHPAENPRLLPEPADGTCRRWAVVEPPQLAGEPFTVNHPDHGHAFRKAEYDVFNGSWHPTGPVTDDAGNVIDANPA